MRDLLEARDQYHIHLMRHPKVVATAVGYYRIRHDDTPPGSHPLSKGPVRARSAGTEIGSDVV
jgi:hypothetical protein